MKKYVMLDGSTIPADYHQERDVLAASGFGCDIVNCATVEDAVEAVKGAEEVCLGTNFFPVDAALLAQMPNVKGVIRYGVGYDIINVQDATEHGVLACNIPHYGATEVATHTMAMLLALCRKITIYNETTKAGKWDRAYGYPMRRLSSLTLGLLGFGSIAQLVSTMVKPFGMKVIAYDPFLPGEFFEKYEVGQASLQEIYAQADILSIHMPANKETFHLINRDTISQMKDGVMIVNTARGAIIHTDDLLSAIKSGKVQAAALDVFEEEPIWDANHPVFQQENLIVSPHTAYNSVEAANALHVQVGETAAAILRGEIPVNAVNKKSFS